MVGILVTIFSFLLRRLGLFSGAMPVRRSRELRIIPGNRHPTRLEVLLAAAPLLPAKESLGSRGAF